jgi:hypothetical protein
MDRSFGTLRVASWLLRGAAILFALVVAGASLVALADVMSYADPYDVDYWLMDAIVPMILFAAGMAVAVFVWAMGDVVLVLLAIEENTRPGAA